MHASHPSGISGKLYIAGWKWIWLEQLRGARFWQNPMSTITRRRKCVPWKCRSLAVFTLRMSVAPASASHPLFLAARRPGGTKSLPSPPPDTETILAASQRRAHRFPLFGAGVASGIPGATGGNRQWEPMRRVGGPEGGSANRRHDRARAPPDMPGNPRDMPTAAGT